MEKKNRSDPQRAPLKQLTAFFAALAMAAAAMLPLLAVDAKAAGNGVWVWRFTRVYNQSDLPGKDAGWFPVILEYKADDGHWYVLDSTKEISKSLPHYCNLQGVAYTNPNGDNAIAAAGVSVYGGGSSELGIPDTYNGDFPYGVWMHYAGTDPNNEKDDVYAKTYYMRDSKNGSAIFWGGSNFSSYQQAKAGMESEALQAFINYHKKKYHADTTDAMGDGQFYSSFTIFTTGYEDTGLGKVKLFSNVDGYDCSFRYSGQSGSTVTISDWCGSDYDYDEFYMYVGERVLRTDLTVCGDYTVNSGSEFTLSNASINMGDTITVQQDATLIIKGDVYFNGTIENYGTVIVDNAVLQATHYLTGVNDTTVYGCYRGYEGSSLIVLGDSRLFAGGDTTASGYNYGRKGTGIELYGGTMINNGLVVAPFGITMTGGAEIVNGSSGKMAVGYYPELMTLGATQKYQPSISSKFSSVEKTWNADSSRRPVVVSFTEEGGKYPILRNKGSANSIKLNAGLVNGSTLNDLTSEETAKMILQDSGSSYEQSANWSKFKTRTTYTTWKNGTAPLW